MEVRDKNQEGPGHAAKNKPVPLIFALLLYFVFGSAIPTPAQQVAEAPNASAGIQFVGKTCGRGLGCSDLNSGLSWGSAKATIPGAAASSACSTNGCSIYVGQSLTSWAGGTLPPNARIVFSGNQTVTLSGTVVFSRGDKLDCISGESSSDASTPLQGTVFSASGLSGTQDAVDLIGHSTSGSEIRGCSFEMNSVGRYGIYDSGSSNNIIEHVTVKDSVSDGVRVDNGNDHAYDLTFINDRVLHAGGAGFDFRTDNGTGDIDRITCMDCQYLPVDPGSSTPTGGPGIELYVPSSAASSQAIADFFCLNCHVGGTASGTDGILIEYAGTGSTVFFHKITFASSLSEDIFNSSNSASAYHVIMPSSSNIQGLELLNNDSGGVYSAEYNPNPPCDSNAWGNSCWVQSETNGWLYENFTGNPRNGAPLIATQNAADTFSSLTVGSGSPVTSSGATCSMSGGAPPNCTITVPSGSAHCIATVQGTTPIAAACSISGTTATITAAAPNNFVWEAIITQ